MTDEQKKKCHKIIHTASAGAMGVGAGFAQIPFADSAILVPIQNTMAISLGKVFGIPVTSSYARSLMVTATTTAIGKAVAGKAVAKVTKKIPGVGNVINASTAAAVTEAAGWAIAEEFDKQSS